MGRNSIGQVGKRTKIAEGLFWADYGYLADTVAELEAGGVDWIHMEMRDGRYMDFNVPRGGIDILTGIRPNTELEIEVQLQTERPSHDMLDQLAEAGAGAVSGSHHHSN